MKKCIGLFCVTACALCVVWLAFIPYLTVAHPEDAVRFDNVRAVEGTVLTVKDGNLVPLEGGALGVGKPLGRYINNSLWGLCFVGCFLGGLSLLTSAKKRCSERQS